MPTTTPINGWPVPVSTDLVKDGAVAIESLGDAIDTSIGTGLQAWGTYAPTVSGGFVVGTGTFATYFKQIGKIVHYQVTFTLATGFTIGNFVMTLPVTARVASAQVHTAWCNAGGTSYPLFARMTSATQVNVLLINASGTYAQTGALAASAPGVWATGNIISITGTYEAA